MAVYLFIPAVNHLIETKAINSTNIDSYQYEMSYHKYEPEKMISLLLQTSLTTMQKR